MSERVCFGCGTDDAPLKPLDGADDSMCVYLYCPGYELLLAHRNENAGNHPKYELCMNSNDDDGEELDGMEGEDIVPTV